MPSLFTDAEKAAIESELSNVHDTFARTIHIYTAKKQSYNSSPSFNALYGRTKDQSIVSSDKILEKESITARIFYPKPNDEERIRDLDLPSSELLCRLKVTVSDAEKIKNAAKIEVDSALYAVASDPKAIGPFSMNYREIWLKRET